LIPGLAQEGPTNVRYASKSFNMSVYAMKLAQRGL
jgi:hypothetical protein